MHSLSKGESPVITVRVSQHLLDQIDRERAANTGLSRSAFIRWALITHVLDLEEARKEGAR